MQRWVLESRRSPDTWLVTKNHILKPPFKVEGKINGKILDVELSGSSDNIEIKLNSIVDSLYREQLGLFLLDSSDAISDFCVIAPFTRHRQLILEAFPPNSKFSSEALYAKVTRSDDSSRPQAHARRRWKELKYNYGFDLDFDGKMYWRGAINYHQRNLNLH
ncbi:hypothetical protein ACFLVN_02485 [Chloroflexota bacterium]